MASGIQYATGALSQAFSDMFSGLNAGQEERRREEEAGRKARAELSEQAFQPGRMENLTLTNQQLKQNIGFDAEKQGWQREGQGWARELHPYAVRQQRAKSVMDEVNAQYQEKILVANLDQQAKRIDLLKTQIERANIENPMLGQTLQAQLDKVLLENKIDTFKYNELVKRRDRRSAAATAFLASNKTPEEITNFFAKYGGDMDANDPLIEWFKIYYDNMGQKDLAKTIQKVQLRNSNLERAQNNAEQEALRQATDLLGIAKVKEGGPEVALAIQWFKQQAKARHLRELEADPLTQSLGITYGTAEKNVPTMGLDLIDTLAAQPGWWAKTPWGNAGDMIRRRQILMRANFYLTQMGDSYPMAITKATQDFMESNRGKATPSDQTYMDFVDLENERAGKPKAKRPAAPTTSQAPASAPVSPLVPSGVPTLPGQTEPTVVSQTNAIEKAKREVERLNRLQEIIDSVPEYQGVTWALLQRPENKEAREHIENLYKRKYGGK